MFAAFWVSAGGRGGVIFSGFVFLRLSAFLVMGDMGFCFLLLVGFQSPAV